MARKTRKHRIKAGTTEIDKQLSQINNQQIVDSGYIKLIMRHQSGLLKAIHDSQLDTMKQFQKLTLEINKLKHISK